MWVTNNEMIFGIETILNQEYRVTIFCWCWWYFKFGVCRNRIRKIFIWFLAVFVSTPTSFFSVEADSVTADFFFPNKHLQSKERREADQGLAAVMLMNFYRLILDIGIYTISVLSDQNQLGHNLCWLGNNKEGLVALFIFYKCKCNKI